MGATTDERPEGRWARVWGFLRGPRFVDLPIRALALIMGLTVVVPGSFETDEPLYVGLLIAAYALLIVTPFAPRTVALIATAAGIGYLWLYPDLENMFPEALILSAGVLLSYFRWWSFAAASLGLLAYIGVATQVGAYDEGLPGLIDLGYGWLMTSVLGLAAGFIELRFRREITRRETAAREHARTVEALRTRFTSDTHDTISHSLSTEAAIIKSLGRAPQAPGTDRMIAELAMVNAEASKRLRQLIGRLQADAPDTSRIELQAEAYLLTSAIRDGSAAGGVRLATTVGDLPAHASCEVGEHFTAFILELATNVIRYSTPGTESRLDVAALRSATDRVDLHYRSINSAEADLTVVPRSLQVRAQALGGDCTVATAPDGRVVVEVVHPVRLSGDGAEAAAGDRGAGKRGAAECVSENFAEVARVDGAGERGGSGPRDGAGPRGGSGDGGSAGPDGLTDVRTSADDRALSSRGESGVRSPEHSATGALSMSGAAGSDELRLRSEPAHGERQHSGSRRG
ncbi:hypothetical protein GCM10009700_00590 [Brevibacterium sanguinis]|uniref:hypothetical protein n=1 Tax=Brevibacterium sanguinis TaxID=232444 RepID=UPI0031D2B1EB